jgi:hypothetical protein
MTAYRSVGAPSEPMQVVTGAASRKDFTVHYGPRSEWVGGAVGGTSRSYVAAKADVRVPTITGT